MGLAVPTLDDRTFEDLLAEARSLIPAVAPDWTDHNPSDPGITLLELFSWLAEMLVYRADQVPDAHLRAFLALLNGPAWQPGASLEDDVAATIGALRDEWRAVTAADFERHALAARAGVLRARAIAGVDLGAETAAARALPQPAHVSVMLLPADAGADQPTVEAAVAAYLAPRRLITTRVVVTEPLWTPVTVGTFVARPADVPAARAEAAVAAALIAFLDARTGGPDGAGWTWGRAVYASELTAALARLPEVDHVIDLTLGSTCPGAQPRCVPGTLAFHDDGGLVALALDAACLPGPGAPAVSATSADDLVPVAATVPVTLAGSVDASAAPAVLGAVRRAVRDLAWPGRGWQPGQRQLAADAIAAAARGVAGVASAGTVTLAADAAVLHRTAEGIAYVAVDSRQLVELSALVVAS